MESPSLARRYHALSSFISSRFSLSFQPHSLCSYLQGKKNSFKLNLKSPKNSPDCAHKANAAVSHGLHVGSGEFEGPFHRERVERRHPLALDLQVEPGRRETGGRLSADRAELSERSARHRALCGQTKQCVPVSVVLFKGWERSQRVIELRGEGPELTQQHTLELEQ